MLQEVKGKGKTLEQATKAKSYSPTLSLISALDKGVWSTPLPGHFTPGKYRHIFYGKLASPDGCGKGGKSSKM
jgi:hypothetical protein